MYWEPKADTPREVLTNDLAISSGFADDMLCLNQRNVDNAKGSLIGREQVEDGVRRGIDAGELSRKAADALLVVGDMQGYLDMAIETAAFYRVGRESQARELERVLEKDVFPHLHPGMGDAYAGLRDRYVALQTDLSVAALTKWCEGVLGILSNALADEGLKVEYRVDEV